MKLLESFFTKGEAINDTFLLELFTHTPVPTFVMDAQEKIFLVNDAFCRLSGYISRELIGQNRSLFKTFRQDRQFYENRKQTLKECGSYKGEVWSRCSDYSERLLLEKVQCITYNSKLYYICVLEDITESRKETEHFQYLAMHDGLTHLANRTLAKDRFTHALANSVRAGEKLGVLLCDLNEFKQVNDQYGHHMGDMLLVEIAKRLSRSVRKGDTVARIGGDEFLIVVERLRSKEELEHLMKKIQKEFQTSFMIDGEVIDAIISIGNACSPEDGFNFGDMLKIADHKMYKEKERFYGLDT